MKNGLLILSIVLISQQAMLAQEKQDSTNYLPGDNELIIMPSARVMPKGSMYFSAYQIVLMNFGYSITNTTQIGVLSVFPINADLISDTFTLGIKQQIWKRDEKYFISISSFMNPGTDLAGFSVQSSNLFQDAKMQVHLNVGWLFDYTNTSNNAMLNGLGIQYNFSKKTAFIGEVLSASNSSLNLKESIEFMTVGIRWRSDYIMFEVAGFRPLEAGTGDLILWPLLKGMVLF
ncbi:hypothetical protein EP331_06085 [bacterium]|nr:MAG: hypothetical protein EP331_06085 [bacterium]